MTLPSCSCDLAKRYIEHDQQRKLLQFLMGLNESYMHIMSQILMMQPLPSVGQAFALVVQEESHRILSSGGSPAVEAPNAVFYSSQGPKKSM